VQPGLTGLAHLPGRRVTPVCAKVATSENESATPGPAACDNLAYAVVVSPGAALYYVPTAGLPSQARPHVAAACAAVATSQNVGATLPRS